MKHSICRAEAMTTSVVVFSNEGYQRDAKGFFHKNEHSKEILMLLKSEECCAIKNWAHPTKIFIKESQQFKVSS